MRILNERTLIILIDALGFDLAEYHGFSPESTPHLTRLRSVLGFSQAAITSILTGCVPAVHGLWMMYSFSEGGSPFRIMKYLQRFADTDRLWLRNLLTWKLARVDRITAYNSLYDVPGKVLPHLDLPARRASFERCGGGERVSVIDAAFDRGEPFIRDYRTPEDQAWEELETALQGGDSEFHLIYTASLDSFLHGFGTGAVEVGEMMRRYGERIDSLASRHQDLRIIVLGDHGMCDVSRHIDLMNAFEGSGLSIPDDYIPFYDATMARFRIPGTEARMRITEILSGVSGGRILSTGELTSLGVGFSDGRFGDIIFLCDTGTIILPSYMGRDPVMGMHGYHPGAGCMDSVMLSNVEFGGGEASVTEISDFLLPGFTGGGRLG
jgi:hypothetical protein